MTFYEKIIQELERAEQSLSTVYSFAFRFRDEALFEWDELEEVRTLTYGEAQQRIESATGALHGLLSDYPKGSPIGIYLPNGPDWVTAFWAILRAGYRPLLLNTMAPRNMVEGCLKAAGAAYFIGTETFSGATGISPATLTGADDYCDWADEIILCTSGTTGAPRLIAFDGKAVCAQIRNSGYVLKHNHSVASFVHGKLKLLAFLPFYHIFGLSAVLLWFSCFGRTLVLLPSLSVRPNTLDEEAFTRKEKYQMQIKASWMIPLAFTGEILAEGVPTLPVMLDGASLGAAGNSKHRIKQNLENQYLPFDCRITPVLTMNGKQPVYLDSFILKSEEQVEYSYDFRPSEDNWKATFHYLVSPARGGDEFFSKDHGYLRIWYTKFTANLE